MDFEAGDH